MRAEFLGSGLGLVCQQCCYMDSLMMVALLSADTNKPNFTVSLQFTMKKWGPRILAESEGWGVAMVPINLGSGFLLAVC